MKNHPKALPYLFLTEMWERFGFYIVQGLLVLYMTEYYGYSDSDSYSILGAFTALAYIAPILGGILADRFLGFKTAIVWGGFILLLGYAFLALPFGKLSLYPGLATVIVGTGLFKPNISSILGHQYRIDDPRRDSGFTIFYIGINVGAFLAGLSSGYIKEYFGWHVSFALASIGLAIGLATFAIGHRTIHGGGEKRALNHQLKLTLLFYFLLAIIAITFLLTMTALTNWVLPSAGVILLVVLTTLTMQQDAEGRKRMILLNTLILSSIIFWMLYLQMFFSANLFIDRLVNKNIFGLHLTTTVFYASESIFIILLGPIFAWAWSLLGMNQKNPSPISKFIFGILFAGLGFLVLSIGALFPDSQGFVNPFWIFGGYLLITVGELLLSPIGLSAVTQLAPQNLVGMMMGVWFVALGFGGIFAGMIAKLSSIPDTVTSTAGKLAIYQTAFMDFAYLAFFVTIVLFFIRAGLKKYLRGV